MIAPVQKKNNNKNKAIIGDKISFKRGKVEYTGSVIAVYENSVCIDILSYNGNLQGKEVQDRTIVSHKRYNVL